MTREEGLNKHRALWHTIAEMLKDGEIDFPISAYECKEMALNRIGETQLIYLHCYCCEVSNGCNECLVIWSDGNCCSGSEYGKFADAINEHNIEGAIKYAEEIANLPAREVVKE